MCLLLLNLNTIYIHVIPSLPSSSSTVTWGKPTCWCTQSQVLARVTERLTYFESNFGLNFRAFCTFLELSFGLDFRSFGTFFEVCFGLGNRTLDTYFESSFGLGNRTLTLTLSPVLAWVTEPLAPSLSPVLAWVTEHWHLLWVEFWLG